MARTARKNQLEVSGALHVDGIGCRLPGSPGVKMEISGSIFHLGGLFTWKGYGRIRMRKMKKVLTLVSPLIISLALQTPGRPRTPQSGAKAEPHGTAAGFIDQLEI
jgi:hypothetical protein